MAELVIGFTQQSESVKNVSCPQQCLFPERIMVDALNEHSGTISIGRRIITSLWFADDIDGLAGSEEELARLVTNLGQTASRYGMEISAEKTKLITNSANPITTRIIVAG